MESDFQPEAGWVYCSYHRVSCDISTGTTYKNMFTHSLLLESAASSKLCLPCICHMAMRKVHFYMVPIKVRALEQTVAIDRTFDLASSSFLSYVKLSEKRMAKQTSRNHSVEAASPRADQLTCAHMSLMSLK